jgi:hypothetical protein
MRGLPALLDQKNENSIEFTRVRNRKDAYR